MRSLPEPLQRLSEQASRRFLTTGTSLTESLRDVVRDRGLKPLQVERVTQMANRLTWQARYQEDRMARFDPADPKDVLGIQDRPEPTRFYESLPPGPVQPLPADRPRVDLYTSPTPATPLGNPTARADEFAGEAKAASYQAAADLRHAKDELAKAASAFEEAVVDTLGRNEVTAGTLVAAVSALEQDEKLATELLRGAFDRARYHVRDFDRTVDLPESWAVDRTHPVAATFLAACGAAHQVKEAHQREHLLVKVAQEARDVSRRIAARSR